MGRYRGILRYVSALIGLFFLSCQQQEVEKIEIPSNIQGIIKRNIALEEKSHREFITYFNEQNSAFIATKTSLFMDEYNSLGTLNIVLRRTNSIEENRSEIKDLLNKIFVHNESVQFQNQLIDSYLTKIQNNRNQQVYMVKKPLERKALVLQKIDDQVIEDSVEEILNIAKDNILVDLTIVALNIWDRIVIVLFLLSLFSFVILKKRNKWLSFLFFLASIIFHIMAESYREKQLRDAVEVSLQNVFKQVESSRLLEELNKNTQYYYE